MKTLDEIAVESKTDKSSEAHGYTKYYAKFFEPIRKEKLNILEIGIQNGYSLKMWREYFPKARIVGLDIVDCKHMDESRVETVVGSQNNPYFLKELHETKGPFDIVIDDGSHQSEDMRISFETLFPLLKSGGIYVVEDLHCCYWPEFANRYTFMTYIKALLDDVNARGKSGYANRATDDFKGLEGIIETVTLARSIIFIHKK